MSLPPELLRGSWLTHLTPSTAASLAWHPLLVTVPYRTVCTDRRSIQSPPFSNSKMEILVKYCLADCRRVETTRPTEAAAQATSTESLPEGGHKLHVPRGRGREVANSKAPN